MVDCDPGSALCFLEEAIASRVEGHQAKIQRSRDPAAEGAEEAPPAPEKGSTWIQSEKNPAT